MGKNSKGSPEGKAKGENKNGKGKSKGKGKPDKAGDGAQPQVQQLDASATASTTASTVGAQQGTQPSTTTTASTAPKDEAVMGEVVNLLKSMRTTQLRVLTVTEMMNHYNGILLDSGGTRILRQPYEEGEWNSAVRTEVQTATGKTQLRMAQNRKTAIFC